MATLFTHLPPGPSTNHCTTQPRGECSLPPPRSPQCLPKGLYAMAGRVGVGGSPFSGPLSSWRPSDQKRHGEPCFGQRATALLMAAGALGGQGSWAGSPLRALQQELSLDSLQQPQAITAAPGHGHWWGPGGSGVWRGTYVASHGGDSTLRHTVHPTWSLPDR